MSFWSLVLVPYGKNTPKANIAQREKTYDDDDDDDDDGKPRLSLSILQVQPSNATTNGGDLLVGW